MLSQSIDVDTILCHTPDLFSSPNVLMLQHVTVPICCYHCFHHCPYQLSLSLPVVFIVPNNFHCPKPLLVSQFIVIVPIYCHCPKSMVTICCYHPCPYLLTSSQFGVIVSFYCHCLILLSMLHSIVNAPYIVINTNCHSPNATIVPVLCHCPNLSTMLIPNLSTIII